MDRDALAQLIAMRGNNPGPQPWLPQALEYIPQDWWAEGGPQKALPPWVEPPPGLLPPNAFPPPPHGLMQPPGPPMGYPLEGRTRFPDDVTRMMESFRLDQMQKSAPGGPMPGGPAYLDWNRSQPGEHEQLPKRRTQVI